MLTIRPFDYSDDDYESMVAIDNAVFVSYALSVEEWRHRDDSRDTSRYFQRDVVEEKGQVVAYGQVEQLGDSHKFFYWWLWTPNTNGRISDRLILSKS